MTAARDRAFDHLLAQQRPRGRGGSAPTSPSGRGPKRVCGVGGGISGLGAAWALGQHPERFAVELYERRDDLGGNAVTVDIPQDDGTSIPVDISVTACIPAVYQNYAELLERFGIAMTTRFSYSVSYGADVYAHDFDSALKAELRRRSIGSSACCTASSE